MAQYFRKNQQIRAREVRVIDENGQQLGVMPLAQALEEARKRNLDLVEVAPQAQPVVCRLIDFGKFKYRQEKREKKRQHTSKLKEIRLTTQIEKHDLETKIRHIRKFLDHDDKVRITVIFRGREILHMDRGHELLDKIIQAVADIGRVEQSPKERGKAIQMLLVPGKGTASAQKRSEGGKTHDQEEDAQGHRQALQSDAP
ncbi:MAG: translation initiation factor IF-3 [Candidatus Bipolaricaulota bacterium]|nr:translation initiation factor IF-3 [Candidatus Bipolaricaulota bacterium]